MNDPKRVGAEGPLDEDWIEEDWDGFDNSLDRDEDGLTYYDEFPY